MALAWSRLAATLAAVIAIGVGAVGMAVTAASGVVEAPGHQPANLMDEFPGDTIIEVTGDPTNGFGIQHLDGSATFPPTDSEARAECSEYDTRPARVRCRTQARTWYRDLDDLKVALAYAHAR